MGHRDQPATTYFEERLGPVPCPARPQGMSWCGFLYSFIHSFIHLYSLSLEEYQCQGQVGWTPSIKWGGDKDRHRSWSQADEYVIFSKPLRSLSLSFLSSKVGLLRWSRGSRDMVTIKETGMCQPCTWALGAQQGALHMLGHSGKAVPQGLGTCCVLGWSALFPDTLWAAPKLPLAVCLLSPSQDSSLATPQPHTCAV